MHEKPVFTYGQLDKRLRALGFTSHTEKGKARIYKHEDSGALVVLPDIALDREVLPHHLVAVRHALNEHDLGKLGAACPRCGESQEIR